MRLCDRDIEAWLDQGVCRLPRVPPLSVLMARLSMSAWATNFVPSVVIPPRSST
jgi:hypothetical protein